MKKKKGFTLPEMLLACTMLAVITLSSISVIAMMSGSLFTSQIESENRLSLSETIFYLTREIQSAEGVKISESGKKLEIKEHGSGEFSLCYEIKEDYPTGQLAFKNKKMLDIDFNESKFESTDGKVIITLSVLENSTDVNQRGKEMNIEAVPRAEAVILCE